MELVIDKYKDSQYFMRTKYPDFSLMFQNSRIIISTHFQFETIFDAIAENSSCGEHSETKYP